MDGWTDGQILSNWKGRKIFFNIKYKDYLYSSINYLWEGSEIPHLETPGDLINTSFCGAALYSKKHKMTCY